MGVQCDAEFMIALLALVVLQADPPPPPPDAKMAAPVLAFWNDQAITDTERRDWRDAARALLANELLAQAAEDWSRSPALRQQRLQALIARLQTLLPYTSREENQRADLCAAGSLVGSLSPQELAEVRTFFRSPAGRRFWLFSRIGERSLIECYRVEMRGSIDAGATLRSIGVRPPAAWDGPPAK